MDQAYREVGRGQGLAQHGGSPGVGLRQQKRAASDGAGAVDDGVRGQRVQVGGESGDGGGGEVDP
ncbi:hypothetical protein SAV14893_092020 [Streptomyces avermitilis]|uniref:Uncharacterized protein n=1 Tax=Streptomyces avermitilis TaxID=33903 RepID=A0A4D4ME08_STRAX|nr:hypothetical protein SAV14893_092020 [Streptomyces avermitilis]